MSSDGRNEVTSRKERVRRDVGKCCVLSSLAGMSFMDGVATFFKGTDSSYWIAVVLVPAIIAALVIMFRRIDKEVI